jgi:hypothetical protein
MVYRLDAVDAYERKLVKQIEVAAATVQGGSNKPYVRVVSVSNKKSIPFAKVELDVATRTGVQRQGGCRSRRRRTGSRPPTGQSMPITESVNIKAGKAEAFVGAALSRRREISAHR